jgi:cytochrome b involved in lipid metabolism
VDVFHVAYILVADEFPQKTGHPGLLRIPPSELKQHRTHDDCWSAFNGKVYNITEYLPYHQGGEKELLRVAGRDGTKLFSSYYVIAYAFHETKVAFSVDACLGKR